MLSLVLPIAAAAAGLTYATAYEVRAFTLRTVTVPVLAAGSAPMQTQLSLFTPRLRRAPRNTA